MKEKPSGKTAMEMARARILGGNKSSGTSKPARKLDAKNGSSGGNTTEDDFPKYISDDEPN
jgi:hypothetical protein